MPVSLAIAALGAFGAAGVLAKNVDRGTAGPDTMYGGPGYDAIAGFEGDDALYGLRSRDLLMGGEGDDLVHGGSGNDFLYGDEGRDRVFGGSGDDRLDMHYTDDAPDFLGGGPGADTCVGEPIDLMSESCEAVGRDDGPSPVGRDDGLSGPDGIPGIVCERGCKLLATKYKRDIYDKNGKIIRRPSQ